MVYKPPLNNSQLASRLLRIGLCVTFLYAAISSTVSPNDWIGYLPHALTAHVSGTLLLKFFSIYEVALAIWLLSGICIRYAALLCAATLAGIIASNYHLLPITFRDLAIMFGALALAALPQETKKTP